MAPYLPHYHVWRAAYRDERCQITYHQQLKPIYESGLLAQAAAEILRRKTARHFHFAEVCHTDPRVCQLKIDRLTDLEQLPIVYHETRQGIVYKKPDLRFQWVQPGHPCAPPAEFCGRRHKSPELAYHCQETTERRYCRLGIQIAAANIVVIYPDRFRDYRPLPADPAAQNYTTGKTRAAKSSAAAPPLTPPPSSQYIDTATTGGSPNEEATK